MHTYIWLVGWFLQMSTIVLFYTQLNLTIMFSNYMNLPSPVYKQDVT